MIKFLRLRILLILGRVNPNLKYYYSLRLANLYFFLKFATKKGLILYIKIYSKVNIK